MSRNIHLPLPVIHTLNKLGRDISSARRRRRITKALMAERAGIALNTLTKIEKGGASASMSAYASVLFVLGLTEHLGALADPSRDLTGIMLEEEQLPQRIRYSRRKE
jgi:transcriptional regulator with XRE-family HTH domain